MIVALVRFTSQHNMARATQNLYRGQGIALFVSASFMLATVISSAFKFAKRMRHSAPTSMSPYKTLALESGSLAFGLHIGLRLFSVDLGVPFR